MDEYEETDYEIKIPTYFIEKTQKGVEVNFTKIRNSNHFFKDKEIELTLELEKYLKEKTALI